jgi:hypothetical protein
MTWPLLLLTDQSPSLRFLVLKKLMKIDDEETKELEKERLNDPLVSELVKLQNSDGSWGKGGLPGNANTSKIQLTSQALTRLGYIGFDKEFEPVRKGAEYLFKRQEDDGSWPLGSYSTDSEGRENYDKMSLQTSIPLRGLAECKYGTCERAEKAYDWLLNQRLDDGAWPTGIAHGNYGYVAGYRRLPHSRWGCRSNTVSALICLSLHPRRCQGEESWKALDLLLGTEALERQHLGYDVARTIGYESGGGFLTYYAYQYLTKRPTGYLFNRERLSKHILKNEKDIKQMSKEQSHKRANMLIVRAALYAVGKVSKTPLNLLPPTLSKIGSTSI